MVEKFTIQHGKQQDMKIYELGSAYNPKLNAMGKSVVNQLFMLIRTIQIHDLDNAALVKPLENLLNTINTVVAMDGSLGLSILENQVFINEHKLKMDTASYGNVEFLAKHLSELDIGCITINKPMDYNALRKFLYLLAKTQKQEGAEISARDLLQKKLLDEQIVEIVLAKVSEKKDDDDEEQTYVKDRRLFALHTYAKAMVAIKDFMNSLPTEGPTDRLRSRRIVQDLVDLCFDDDLLHIFLGLTSIKNYDEYLYNHAVNVCILAIAFGRRLGLPKKKLLELGLAGLFCDIGKAYLSGDLLHKKEELNNDEWRQMKEHSTLAVKAFLMQKGLSEDMIKRMIVAFEHHMDFNMQGGYPKIENKKDLNLYSRIIAIVDNFDALTTAKEYRDAYMPDEALKIMYEQSGEKFDPVLLRVFMNMIGMYPIGTMVQLSSGEMAVVYHNSHDPRKYDRPKVKLVLDAQGNRVKGTQILDLTAAPAGGAARSIVRTVDPAKIDVNIANVLLGA